MKGKHFCKKWPKLLNVPFSRKLFDIIILKGLIDTLNTGVLYISPPSIKHKKGGIRVIKYLMFLLKNYLDNPTLIIRVVDENGSGEFLRVLQVYALHFYVALWLWQQCDTRTYIRHTDSSSHRGYSILKNNTKYLRVCNLTNYEFTRQVSQQN